MKRFNLALAALFNTRSCVRCHREGGVGGERARNLTDKEWVQSDGSLEGIRETIFWGVRRKDFHDPDRPFEMNPAGGTNLTWDEVSAVGRLRLVAQQRDVPASSSLIHRAFMSRMHGGRPGAPAGRRMRSLLRSTGSAGILTILPEPLTGCARAAPGRDCCPRFASACPWREYMACAVG